MVVWVIRSRTVKNIVGPVQLPKLGTYGWVVGGICWTRPFSGKLRCKPLPAKSTGVCLCLLRTM